MDEEGEQEMQEGDDEDSQLNDDDISKMKVRKLLAHISVPLQDDEQPIVFSYHYKYEKYLRDNHLIDPEKAKMALYRAKKQ